jgi:hypothetical protein
LDLRENEWRATGRRAGRQTGRIFGVAETRTGKTPSRFISHRKMTGDLCAKSSRGGENIYFTLKVTFHKYMEMQEIHESCNKSDQFATSISICKSISICNKSLFTATTAFQNLQRICAPIRFAHDNEFHILFLSLLEYWGDSRGDAQAFGKATIYEIFLLLL